MLALSDITVRIEEAVLLDGVSLDVHPGEVVAVVGPNGAGKTTLLNVAVGEWTPSAGTVSFEGQPLHTYDREHLAQRRAVLPQKSNLTFNFTAFEVARLGRTPHHAGATEDDKAAWRGLSRAGVDHLATRKYPTLSGGEQQRVHLARTLTQLDVPEHPTQYLLLDEPTAALDIAHQHSVLRMAKSMAEEGAGVLVILHDLNLAAQYADRLAVLRKGRLLAEGPPADILDADLVHAAFDVAVMVVPHPCLSCPLVVHMPDGTPVPPGGDGLPGTEEAPIPDLPDLATDS